MNLNQISESLERLFNKEGERLVFWNDVNGDFEDMVDGLTLDGVTLVRTDREAALAIKHRVEYDEPATKFLLYAAEPEPRLDDDWLLDIRLYSRSFNADRSSMLIKDLGLSHESIRGHLVEREVFFRSRERTERLKKLISPEDLGPDLDLKMLAVVVRAEQPELFQVLFKLMAGWAAENDDLSQPPTAWAEIEKYGLESFFWEQLAQRFGYTNGQPSFENWLLHMLATDLARSVNGPVPPQVGQFVLESKAFDVTVFMNQWRSNAQFATDYTRLSAIIGEKLQLSVRLADFSAEQLQGSMTFETVEQRVLSSLRNDVITAAPGGWEEIATIAQRRRDGFWCQPHSGNLAASYTAAYNAIDAASQLFKLRQTYTDGLHYKTAEAMFTAYQTELYRFDQSYRSFIECVDKAESNNNWDVLKPLRERVEECYANWYMDQLATAWGALIAKPNGELRQPWRLEGVDRQVDFFSRHVEPQMADSKVFVIISDAFRYEAAEELTRELNGRYRYVAELKPQLGVLPSYTALGMAALLPHKTLSYKLNANADVLVDGQPTVSLEHRSAILASHQGAAFKAEDVLEWKRDVGRDMVKPHRVIYIYHDRIDAMGDKSATESLAFQAVRQTIEELKKLIIKVIDTLNGGHVVITADHGFLFQDSDPTALDKSALSEKPAGALKAKKRFILGTQLGQDARAWHGTTAQTADAEGGMELWIPKGANRFHFVGGARFIHGGAMPQEVMVPVIVVKEKEGAAAVKTNVKPVKVTLLAAPGQLKVTNNVQRFELLQTEGVSERRPARVLAVSLRDAENQLISDEVRLTFDCVSENMQERKRTATLTLLAGDYDKHQTYHLVLSDANDGIEYERYPVKIDLAFQNEF